LDGNGFGASAGRQRGRGDDDNQFDEQSVLGREVERPRVAALGKEAMVTLPLMQAPFEAVNSATTAASSSTNSDNLNMGLGGTQLNTQDFISILTAQLKYQDPLNPVDPNQFVGEMAQFGSLNELIGIKTDLDRGLQNSQTPPASQAISVTDQSSSNRAAGISQ
jgi:flagellar basal-body rod modification protein FlgD